MTANTEKPNGTEAGGCSLDPPAYLIWSGDAPFVAYKKCYYSIERGEWEFASHGPDSTGDGYLPVESPGLRRKLSDALLTGLLELKQSRGKAVRKSERLSDCIRSAFDVLSHEQNDVAVDAPVRQCEKMPDGKCSAPSSTAIALGYKRCGGCGGGILPNAEGQESPDTATPRPRKTP